MLYYDDSDGPEKTRETATVTATLELALSPSVAARGKATFLLSPAVTLPETVVLVLKEYVVVNCAVAPRATERRKSERNLPWCCA